MDGSDMQLQVYLKEKNHIRSYMLTRGPHELSLHQKKNQTSECHLSSDTYYIQYSMHKNIDFQKDI